MTKPDPLLEDAFLSSVRAIGCRNRPDGTRLVIRRHHWGFSETVLKRDESNYWKTVTHAEYRATTDVTDLRAVLLEAREFVDNHSEDWYLRGQALLKKIDEALK